MGEAVQGGTFAGASQTSQSPSLMGNNSGVKRKMGSIKDSTIVLDIAAYIELRRGKVNSRELKIDRTMEYGQARLLVWDHVAEVK